MAAAIMNFPRLDAQQSGAIQDWVRTQIEEQLEDRLTLVSRAVEFGRILKKFQTITKEAPKKSQRIPKKFPKITQKRILKSQETVWVAFAFQESDDCLEAVFSCRWHRS